MAGKHAQINSISPRNKCEQHGQGPFLLLRTYTSVSSLGADESICRTWPKNDNHWTMPINVFNDNISKAKQLCWKYEALSDLGHDPFLLNKALWNLSILFLLNNKKKHNFRFLSHKLICMSLFLKSMSLLIYENMFFSSLFVNVQL